MMTEHFGQVTSSMRAVLEETFPGMNSLTMASLAPSWTVRDGHVHVFINGPFDRVPGLRARLQKVADKAVWEVEARLRTAVTKGYLQLRDLGVEPYELGLPRQWREGLLKILHGIGGSEIHEELYFRLRIVEASRAALYSAPDVGRYVLLDLDHTASSSSICEAKAHAT
jgi:hypothetical protein